MELFIIIHEYSSGVWKGIQTTQVHINLTNLMLLKRQELSAGTTLIDDDRQCMIHKATHYTLCAGHIHVQCTCTCLCA